jgi:crotonobetainyl-CoA:carnitine CoA-transferase CaiB-like acyl-CoA transferase
MGADPLDDIRVLDAARLLAGPLAAMLLADFGAEVIKIEHPSGDAVRNHGHDKHGVSLWWKTFARNKRAVNLSLSLIEGQELMCRLVEKADVLIESFRPDTLERWNLSPQRLQEMNPRLVIARVTGFGQIGPYRNRPGFGTLAEAMSGFAAITGEPDGPPTLPPFGLADGITGLATAFAVLTALHARTRTGRGQVIDMAIIEPILTILGPQPSWFDQLGVIQERVGNRSVNNAPRNVYRTSDGRWVAISTSAQSVAERVMRLVLDLEDAVALDRKQEVRKLVADRLRRQMPGEGPSIYVRINWVNSNLWKDDLETVVAPCVQGIGLPKADSAKDIKRLGSALGDVERAAGIAVGSISIIPTVETVAGVLAAAEMATMPRVEAFCFGAADFLHDIGVEGRSFRAPDAVRSVASGSGFACRGIAASHRPRLHSGDGSGRAATFVVGQPAAGLLRPLLYPSKADSGIREVFSSSPDEVAEAKRIAEAFERASAQGSSSLLLENGHFVDQAVARRARDILELAARWSTANMETK